MTERNYNTNLKVREYNRIEDPGHSWLEIPLKDLHDLNFNGQITPYSPINGGKVYLEEDCDMYTFITEMHQKGITVKMNRVFIEDFDVFLGQ